MLILLYASMREKKKKIRTSSTDKMSSLIATAFIFFHVRAQLPSS